MKATADRQQVVAVTGGAGAIGSRLVSYLLVGGAHVIVYDDLSSGHRWLLPGSARLEFRQVDVAELQALPSGVDAVYHLAAHFANANSVEHPFADLQTNGLGTLRVLDAAVRANAGRVVFASAGCAANHEDTPYQIHKSLGEAYCRYFSDRVPTVVCRFHNSYGLGEIPGQWRNVVPNWIWAALHDEPLTIFGDGTDKRDFVFVDDLVSEMVSAESRLVEIGTGVLTSTNALAELIVDLTKSRSKIVRNAPRRRWDHAGRPACTDRRERVPLPEGISRTIAWFRDNYEQIKGSVR